MVPDSPLSSYLPNASQYSIPRMGDTTYDKRYLWSKIILICYNRLLSAYWWIYSLYVIRRCRVFILEKAIMGNSWFGYFLRSLKELVSRNACIERKNERYISLWWNLHSLGPSQHDQVGNEHHFIGVFYPKVGSAFHFLLQKMTEPWASEVVLCQYWKQIVYLNVIILYSG